MGTEVISRRAFHKQSAKLLYLSLALGPAAALEGCDPIKFLIDYIPTINSGISVISEFFGAMLPPVVGPIINTIKALLLDILGAATAYQQDTNPADKATALAKIETFVKEMIAGFQSVLDNLASIGIVPVIVMGVINIILSTLSWLLGKFAAITGARLTLPGPIRLHAGTQILVITPMGRTQKQFRDDVNYITSVNGRSDLKI